jgi:hypothetical protein
MLVATNMHVTLRSSVVLIAWIRDERELVWHVTLWNNTTPTLHFNNHNHNDNNMMHASMWFGFFDGLFFFFSKSMIYIYMGGKCDKKE